MGRAAARIAKEANGYTPPMGDLQQAEFAFNKLFVGPMALQAPPFASVYLDPEPLVMGRSTLEVRELYHALGLASQLEGSLPDDHLGLELDCAAALRAALEQRPDPSLQRAWKWLVAEHMAVWVPQFVRRVEESDAGHPVITYCVRQLLGWLEEEIAALSGEQALTK